MQAARLDGVFPRLEVECIVAPASYFVLLMCAISVFLSCFLRGVALWLAWHCAAENRIKAIEGVSIWLHNPFLHSILVLSCLPRRSLIIL